MGRGMSNNLLKKGFVVKGYDVIPSLIDQFIRNGGEKASSPKAAAEATDILLLMVVNSAQVNSVLFQEESGAVNGLRSNAAIIISSTVPGSYVREIRGRLDREFGRPDILLLDCPVSGGASGAAEGTLTIFACGTDEGMERADAVLQAVGTNIHRIRDTEKRPGTTGSGANGKVCHQVLPEIAIALVAEVMALATRVGMITQEVYDHIQAGEGASWIMADRIPHALQGDETVYSAMTNSQKDSSIVVRTASELSVPVPLVATAEQVYQTAVNIGWAGMDDSALWRLYLREQPDDAVFRQSMSPSIARDDTVHIQDLVDIMVGVHLAATAEFTLFTRAVGLDMEQMYSIVSQAAGWNVQFERFALEMGNGHRPLQAIAESREAGRKLVSTVAGQHVPYQC
jgi:3-hydroxyisobutyrate dehydrogenase